VVIYVYWHARYSLLPITLWLPIASSSRVRVYVYSGIAGCSHVQRVSIRSARVCPRLEPSRVEKSRANKLANRMAGRDARLSERRMQNLLPQPAHSRTIRCAGDGRWGVASYEITTSSAVVLVPGIVLHHPSCLPNVSRVVVVSSLPISN
jgi:hypothetical protein